MGINQTYAVFGLGRYGSAVARALVASGAEVLAVDADEAVVREAAAYLPLCKCANATSREVIERLGIANIDVVIVAMATHLESSVLTVMLCKEAGVGTVIAKCSDEMSGKVLEKVGADKVVLPESESGTRLAKNLLSSGFVDMMELSRDASLIELDMRAEWVGKTLSDLDLRGKYGINVVALHTGERIETEIDPRVPLAKNTRLIVICNATKLKKLHN